MMRRRIRTSSILAPLLAALLCPWAPVVSRAQTQGEGILVSLDADNTSLDSILAILAARGGQNIVTGSDVQDVKITVHLKNTPFEEALNLVVRSAGLGYERVGSSILVADPQLLVTPTGLITRVFDLQYANAAELKKMLEVLSGDISANAAGNRLVVRASQSVIEQVAAVIERLDRKPQQVLLEARLIEVNRTALQQAGIDWERITSFTTLLTEGNPGKSAKGQLPDEVEFFKLGETDDFHRQIATFELAIQALITDGSARLLSNSKVVTVDGTRAEIFAGETVPVVITSLQGPGGGGGVLQTVQLEKIDVGIKLNITPRIAEGGYVTTLVESEIARILGFVGPGNDLPQTSTRRARAQIRVRAGEKIYLGGLLSEEKRRTVKKVPILGQIPLLGYLFRQYRDEDVRLDLVVEITPRIVGDEGAGLYLPGDTEIGER